MKLPDIVAPKSAEPKVEVEPAPVVETQKEGEKPYIGLKIVGKIDLTKFERPKKEIVPGKKNYYIIDTNVFVNCPDIINRISNEYPVILSAKVADELDKMKIKLNEQGKVSENTVRKLPTYHAIVLAKNETGRVNLYRMVSESHLKYYNRRPCMPDFRGCCSGR